MSASAQHTVRDYALRIRGATRVFEQAGIDYCCGGERSLEEACVRAGIDTDVMLVTLRALEAQPSQLVGDEDCRAMTLEALVDHIVRKHHAFTTRELVRLGQLLSKVVAKHGPSHPELATIEMLFGKLCDDLVPHMQKEEVVLFPYVVKLDRANRSQRPVPVPPFVTVRNPIRMMASEHDMAGDLLRDLRDTSHGYKLPADACMTFQALYEGLEALERDLHVHIHLENNLLFPRAVSLEARVCEY